MFPQPPRLQRSPRRVHPKNAKERYAVEIERICNDPHITFVRPLDLFVTAYLALGPDGPRVAVAVSEDLETWQQLGLVETVPQ